jgi:hypothetical protein
MKVIYVQLMNEHKKDMLGRNQRIVCYKKPIKFIT